MLKLKLNFRVNSSNFINFIHVDEIENLQKYKRKIINQDLLGKDYDKSVLPNLSPEPLQVNISMYIKDINSISETTMVILCF